MPKFKGSAIIYRVACREPFGVRREVRQVWTRNLRLPSTSDERFDWLYVDKPGGADPVLVLEASEAESTAIVGSSGMVARDFWIGSHGLSRAVISCNFVVDQQHRTLLPALRLLSAFRDEVEARYDFAYGFPNSKAEGVLRRAGFREVGRTKRLVKILRYSAYVDRVLTNLGASRHSDAGGRLLGASKGVAAIVDSLSSLGRRLRSRQTLRRFEVKTQSTADERWDALWLRARAEYRIVGDRTAAYLNWRFKTCPNVFYLTLEDRRDGSLLAYSAVQIEAETGAAHIRDVFGHRDALAPLIDTLLLMAWDAGAASVSVRLLGSPDVERHLASRGFSQRDDARCVVVHSASRFERHASDLAESSNWHLFDVDEDS